MIESLRKAIMTASWIRTMLIKIDLHKMKNVLKSKETLMVQF